MLTLEQLRATLEKDGMPFPRFREDQLQSFAWKVLIPVSLVNIMVTAVLKVAF